MWNSESLQSKKNKGEGNKRHFGHYEANLKSYLPGKVVHLEYKSSNLPGKVSLIWNTKFQFFRGKLHDSWFLTLSFSPQSEFHMLCVWKQNVGQ